MKKGPASSRYIHAGEHSVWHLALARFLESHIHFIIRVCVCVRVYVRLRGGTVFALYIRRFHCMLVYVNKFIMKVCEMFGKGVGFALPLLACKMEDILTQKESFVRR